MITVVDAVLHCDVLCGDLEQKDINEIIFLFFRLIMSLCISVAQLRALTDTQSQKDKCISI